MKVNIGLTEEASRDITTILSKLVADEFVLFTKTRNAHYNVEGIDFHSMHLFFEGLYEDLEENVDEVSERIRQLGHYAPATLGEYLKLTQLTEKRSTTANDSKSWIADLLKDHEAIIIFIRENIETIENFNDNGTADFLIGLMEKHEKTAWMLRAHLK